jgi:hypothetical protein
MVSCLGRAIEKGNTEGDFRVLTAHLLYHQEANHFEPGVQQKGEALLSYVIIEIIFNIE